MDPISMTASITAILQSITTLRASINDTSHVTGEYQKLAIETSNLHDILARLRFRVEEARFRDPWFNQVELLQRENIPLNHLKHFLEEMVKRLSLPRRDLDKLTLTDKFTKSDVDDAQSEVERIKLLVQKVLNDDLFPLTQAIHGNIETLGNQMGQQIYTDQEVIRLARWLGVSDQLTSYYTALRHRHPNTLSWFVDGVQFNDWRKSPSSLMWLHGIPGSGKTVISATALQHIFRYQESRSDTAVGYFFFAFNNTEAVLSSHAIRSLLFQLARQESEGLQSLNQMYQNCESGQKQPSEDMVRSLLQGILARIRFKYLVLDALDECTDREALLAYLRSLLDSKLTGLHIMVASRREMDIKEVLSPITTHNINIQPAVVDKDIRRYIRHQLATDPKLKTWSISDRMQITHALQDNSNGMFLWVALQLDSIRQCNTGYSLQKALSTLPKSLDKIYDRKLRDLESRGQLPGAITVLQWLCFSSRPLTLSEIREVLAVKTGDNGGFFPEERPEPVSVVFAYSSLVSVVDGDIHSYKRLRRDDGDDTPDSTQQIQLVHPSVKQYLLSDRCFLRSEFEIITCQKQLAEGCLRCLLYVVEQAPLIKELVEQYPLVQYAAEYWWQHAQIIEADSPRVVDLALKLLTIGDVALLSWIQLWNPDRPETGFDLTLTSAQVGTPLYYAAFLGLPNVINNMLQQTGVYVNAQGGQYGNALQAVSYRGYEKVVQMLLDAGADPNAQGGEYGNALQAASVWGHEQVIQMLLDTGADPNAQGGQYDNALQAASVWGHEQVIQMLLDAGADPNAQGGEYGNALQAASVRGYEKVVQILLDAGVDPNAQGGKYGNALQAASVWGHEQVIQILLDAGADPNAQGGEYGNALQAASYRGYEKVVQILLDAGADPNAQGDQYGNALQAASVQGHEQVIQILLGAGADPKAQGGKYGNALQAASVRGYEKVVQILLDAGADPNAQGDQYGNALQAASVWGHEQVIQILLDAGTDPNAQGGKYGNALQAASYRGYEKVVQILLGAGADPNAQGGKYGNALQAASVWGHEQVIQMLLGARADPKAQGKFDNAIQAASFRGDEKVVQMPFESGAEVSDALQAALAGGLDKELQMPRDPVADYNRVRNTDDPDSDHNSVISTLMGSIDSTSYAKAARDYLRRLFNQDYRLEPLFSTVVDFSTLGEQALADILNRHFRTFAKDLIQELHAKRGTENREACKLILYHARSLASEIAQFSYRQKRQEVFTSLHAQSKAPGQSELTRRFLDRQDTTGLSPTPAYRSVDDEEEGSTRNENEGQSEEDNTDDSGSDTALSDQLDHQSLILEAFLRLFEQSHSFTKLVDSLWHSVEPDLFDWWSIKLHWQQELSESAPIVLRYLAPGNLRHIQNDKLYLSDNIKLALEQFTAQPWDWWPFKPPNRPISAGKTRLSWDSCCGRIQSFDVSTSLAEKVKRFVESPVEMRKETERPPHGGTKTQPSDDPKVGGSASAAVSGLAGPSPPSLPTPAASQPKSSRPKLSRKSSSSSRASTPPTSTSSQQNNPPQQQKRFILLCVRNMSGPNSLRHCQIEILRDMTDNTFFEEFRRQYRNLRGWFYWLHPDQFWFCHCSKFYKWDADKISWESHEMPSDDSYAFRPKPPSHPYCLPVSRDEWEHRYHQNCSLPIQSNFLDRIPIRNERFQIETCVQAHQVWGLNAQYRTSARVILAWSFICISPGILFFILWLVHFANDLQNASVPLTLILSSVVLPIGLVSLGGQFKGIQAD